MTKNSDSTALAGRILIAVLFLDGDADFRRASRAGGAKDSSDATPGNPEDRRTRKGPEQGGERPR